MPCTGMSLASACLVTRSPPHTRGIYRIDCTSHYLCPTHSLRTPYRPRYLAPHCPICRPRAATVGTGRMPVSASAGEGRRWGGLNAVVWMDGGQDGALPHHTGPHLGCSEPAVTGMTTWVPQPELQKNILFQASMWDSLLIPQAGTHTCPMADCQVGLRPGLGRTSPPTPHRLLTHTHPAPIHLPATPSHAHACRTHTCYTHTCRATYQAGGGRRWLSTWRAVGRKKGG